MPEGPTIAIMYDDIRQFIGKKVYAEIGSSTSEDHPLKNKTLKDIKTYGKQTFLIFDGLVIRIHLMMYGSYSLAERTDIKTLRLGLQFKDGGMYFYTCTVKYEDETFLNNTDWESDIMSDFWNPKKAAEKLSENPEMLVCDALMDQKIFTGVGNIIKNEALFRAGIHPESPIGNLSEKMLNVLFKETRSYSFDFKEWKKENTLKRKFQVYHKTICPKCGEKIQEMITGKSRRNSFFCPKDQRLY